MLRHCVRSKAGLISEANFSRYMTCQEHEARFSTATL
jgi:hypothetical protein